MPGVQAAPSPDAVFGHDALLFDDDQGFVSRAAEHLREGAAGGEQVLVACTEPRRRLLLAALGGSLEVMVLENGEDYPRPVATAQRYVDLTRDALRAGARGLRVVEELPANALGHPRLWPQWSRHEAVVNHALAPWPFRALCAYDVRSTPSTLADSVRRTHRHLWGDSGMQVNHAYTDPADCLMAWADPERLGVESSPPMLEVLDINHPREARAARVRVEQLLTGIDTVLVPYAEHLPPADPTLVEADEYVLGVDEVLANALIHGTGPVTLRVWVLHDQVVTTVTDRGEGFVDPFAGYALQEPLGPAPGRRPLGLWLARQMCEELSVRHDEEGFTVRLRADLDVRAP